MKKVRFYPFFAFLLIGMLFSCRPDDTDSETGPDDVSFNDSCQVGLFADAETTTIIRVYDPSDQNLLTQTDRALMLPERERRLQEVCLESNGNYIITTTMAEPNDPIILPENTVGLKPASAWHKIVNENGNLTYYNAQNEEIDGDWAGDMSQEVLATVQEFAELSAAPALSQAQVDAAIQQMIAAGANISHLGNDLYSLRTNYTDGSYSLQIINKTVRMATGTMHFNAAGEPQSIMMMKVTGQAPNVTIESITDILFFNAIESGVRLQREKKTIYHAFQLHLN